MSIEGAIPLKGHLGAIVYDGSAINDVRMEDEANLFATFHRMDPGWAVVEFNTADFRTPDDLPTYSAGYRALREMFNFGARFASPMAWNGSNGIYAGQPGYVSFMAWRNTPLEDAMRDFAVSHAYVPSGTRLWTFGSSRHVDADGWTASPGASASPGSSYLEVKTADAGAALFSPSPLALSHGEADLLVLGVDPDALVSIEVDARAPDGSWIALSAARASRDLATTPAGISVPLAWPPTLAGTDQLRMTLTPRQASSRIRIRHIALLPPPAR